MVEKEFHQKPIGNNERFMKELDTKEKSNRLKAKKRINWFVNNTVKKPIIFAAYILSGIMILLICITKIKVPVYETYTGLCIRESEDSVVVELNRKVEIDDTVFVYLDREEKVWKLTNYNISGKSLIIHDHIEELVGQDIFVDVSTKEISLLEMIMMEGGNE